MAVGRWVKDIVESSLGKSSLSVGAVVRHPSGRTVKITGGQYWGEYGISNFWYWREVLPGGKLSKTEEHGYGWV
jgi:hypothetical protein